MCMTILKENLKIIFHYENIILLIKQIKNFIVIKNFLQNATSYNFLTKTYSSNIWEEYLTIADSSKIILYKFVINIRVARLILLII